MARSSGNGQDILARAFSKPRFCASFSPGGAMHVGVSFPLHGIGSDPTALRDWAQASEDLGFDQVIVMSVSSDRTPLCIPIRISIHQPFRLARTGGAVRFSGGRYQTNRP